MTVSGTPVGNGIFLAGSVMTLSGVGINSNIRVLDQISSSGSLTGVAGVYKVSYNPNTLVQTIYANDSITNNNKLYVSSVSSGSIQLGMQFSIAGVYMTINSLFSPGVYTISTQSGVIPSIYPQQISAVCRSISNSITLNVEIPDGFNDSTSLNFYLQNVCIANNCYLTYSTGSLFPGGPPKQHFLWISNQRVSITKTVADRQNYRIPPGHRGPYSMIVVHIHRPFHLQCWRGSSKIFRV